MLDTDTTNQLPLVPSVFHHTIAGANALGRVVVQRVTDVAVTAGRQKDLVEIVPVLAQVLRIARSRGGVESIFIEETVAVLVAIHTACREVEGRAVVQLPLVAQVHISRLVAIRVMLPTAGRRIGALHVVAQHEDLHVIGRLAEGLREHGGPVQAQGTLLEERVLALQSRVDDVLMIPFHADSALLLILAIADLGLAHVHVTVIPCELMPVRDLVIELDVGADAGLLGGIVAVLNTIMALARLVIELALLAPIGIQIAGGHHHAQLVGEETIAIRQATDQVGQRLFPFHPHVVGREVVHRHPVIFRKTFRLVRRLLDDRPAVERLEITVEIHGVITGREVGRKLPLRRRIFHDQVHRATDTVALHIGRQ